MAEGGFFNFFTKTQTGRSLLIVGLVGLGIATGGATAPLMAVAAVSATYGTVAVGKKIIKDVSSSISSSKSFLGKVGHFFAKTRTGRVLAAAGLVGLGIATGGLAAPLIAVAAIGTAVAVKKIADKVMPSSSVPSNVHNANLKSKAQDSSVKAKKIEKEKAATKIQNAYRKYKAQQKS